MSRSIAHRLLPSGFLAALMALAPMSDAKADGAGPGLGDKPFTVTINKVAAKPGQEVTVPVVFHPAKGWHVNTEFPTGLKLSPPAGVTAQKLSLNKQDAQLTEEEGRFNVSLKSSEAGKKTVPGVLRFAVCSATTCDPQQTAIAIELEVK